MTVNIVYKIPCLDCDGSYVGQTSKTLQSRILQHKYNVRTYNNNSAIFKRISNNDHRMDWNNSCKIINSNNWLDRNIIESFIINNLPSTFNISTGLCSVVSIITKLLKTDFKSILNI